MFRRGNTVATPEVRRHAIGEVAIPIDAVLRDAELREEAEEERVCQQAILDQQAYVAPMTWACRR